jgi:RIO-like serine/threonine protein kinase
MTRRAAAITREEFLSRAGPNIAKDAWHRPEVRRIDIGGFPALVKDYSRRPLLYRETWGRFMIDRETLIFREIDGLPGIPRYLGRIDATAFAMEYIEGEECGDVALKSLSAGFFVRLADTVRAMHARNIFHGDLRQRRNILVGPGEQPYLIDFASGLRVPRDTALGRFLARTDLSGVAKLKRKLAPHLIDEDDMKLLLLDRLRPWKMRRIERRMERKRAELES